MHFRTLQKLAREHCEASPALHVAETEVGRFRERLHQRLSTMPGIRLRSSSPGADETQQMLSFSIVLPEGHDSPWYDYHYRLCICRNASGEIALFRNGTRISGLSAIDALEPFAQAYLERLRRTHAGAIKREKIQTLRVQALQAKVKEIAKAQQFDFLISHNSQHCQVYLRTIKNGCIEIRIPWSQYQVILPRLEAMIPQLRALHDEGLRFTCRQLTRPNWIKHDDL